MAERGYTIKRTFDAPPEVVFEAWTDPEQFAIGFGTEEAEMHHVELDVRPGGRWKGTMASPAAAGSSGGRRPRGLEADRLRWTSPTKLAMSTEPYTATFTGRKRKTELGPG